MTYTTHLHPRQSTSRSKMATMTVLVLMLVALQSSTANAQWTTNVNNINNTNTGYVGIGTDSPTAKLHVSGSGNIFSILQSTSAAVEFHLTSSAAGSSSWAMGTGWAGSGAIRNLYLYDNVAGATRLLINSSGNVGIGTSSPAQALEIKSTGGTRARITMANGTSGGLELYTSGGTSKGGVLYYEPLNVTSIYGPGSSGSSAIDVNSSNNVGIGTTGPGKKLVIQSDTANDHLSIVRPTTNAATLNIGVDNTGPFFESTTVNRPISIYTHNGTSVGERVRIDKDGNVGIGMTSPANKLHVAGSITVDGNINAKYQDVAEWVPSTHALAAGTVVTLDPTKSNHVEASSQAYDTRVAGVISAQPGIALGERGENKVLVATTGRVRVKVDASRAPIRIGDLLVTGDTPGVAMKSEPITIGGRQMHSPGTLIGKALEPLEKDRGEILVLLSLQ